MKNSTIAVGRSIAAAALLLCGAYASAEEITSGDFKYEVDGNEAIVKELTNSAATTITIPATISYNGKEIPVTKIDEYACAFSDITEATIGDNVKTLGEGAFYWCQSMTTVTMGNGVTEIGLGCFADSPALADISWSPALKTIGEEAFSGDTGISGEITLGANIRNINSTAFLGCTNLSGINIDEANSYLASEGGIVYDKNKTTLILYPNGKSDASLVIPSTVKELGTESISNNVYLESIILNEGLTKIGTRAFANDVITSINIPSTVTELGESPFYGCVFLTEVNSSNENFKMSGNYLIDASKQEILQYVGEIPSALVIPEGYVSIGTGAFSDQSITSVEIPASMRKIGKNAFMGCTELVTVTIPEGLETMGESCFENCESLVSCSFPSTLRTLERSVFSFCSSLDIAMLPDGLESIGVAAFFQCEKLRKSRIPSSVKKWEYNTFFNCFILDECEIGDGITEIPEDAFVFCYNLRHIDIPSSVKRIGNAAFSICPLEEIILPESLESIGKEAFSGCPELTEVVIPDNCREIEDNAFMWCTKLKKFTCGKGLKKMGNRVLQVEDALEEVILNEGLEELGPYCISWAPKMTTLTLPSTLTKFDDAAIFGIPLTSLIVKMPTPPEVPENIFMDNDNVGIFGTCTLTVPYGTVDTYKNAPIWSKFYKIEADMSGIDETAIDESSILDIYTLDGLKVNELVRGKVNIVRMTDGTVKKVNVPK